MVLEKRKNFMQKNGTERSLFRLRLRLLHAMLDVILIVCLVIFVVAWLVSNDWDCLMSLWINHVLFYYVEAFIWFSPLMLYLGWLGACLQHVWLLQSRHKPLWSFSFWLLLPFYASSPKNQVMPMCPPCIPISSLLFQVHLTCFYLSFELNFFGVMRKLVSKALTNLMAHFTFLILIFLTLWLFYVDVMLASCKLGISQTMPSWGKLSTLHFSYLSWYRDLLFIDTRDVKQVGNLAGSWSLYMC
jgi:hypothetical protein